MAHNRKVFLGFFQFYKFIYLIINNVFYANNDKFNNKAQENECLKNAQSKKKTNEGGKY